MRLAATHDLVPSGMGARSTGGTEEEQNGQ